MPQYNSIVLEDQIEFCISTGNLKSRIRNPLVRLDESNLVRIP